MFIKNQIYRSNILDEHHLPADHKSNHFLVLIKFKQRIIAKEKRKNRIKEKIENLRTKQLGMSLKCTKAKGQKKKPEFDEE